MAVLQQIAVPLLAVNDTFLTASDKTGRGQLLHTTAARDTSGPRVS